MDDVLDLKRQKRYRLNEICTRVLNCIRAKVRVAMACSVREVPYNFRTINTHGCPMLPQDLSEIMKNYVKNKLLEEGFKIDDISIGTDDTEWGILIRW